MFRDRPEGQAPAAPRPKPDKAELTLKESAAYLGISEMRMRSLVRDKRIEGAHQVKREGTEVKQWQCPVTGLDKYAATKGTFGVGGGKRTGKTWIAKVTGGVEQVEAFQKWCAAQNPPVQLLPRFKYNREKSKAYRVARNAKLKAEKAAAKK
jgi:hypothetical protein